MLNILDALFSRYFPDPSTPLPQPLKGLIPEQIEIALHGMLLFAITWSAGASLLTKDRRSFDTKIRELCAGGVLKIMPPVAGTVFDSCFDPKTQTFVRWMDTIKPFKVETGLPFDEVIVPTVDSVRHSYVLDLLVSAGKNVLIAGETGTQKTVVVKEKLLRGLQYPYRPVFMSFSATTSANQVQDFIDSKLEKRRKGMYAPTSGNKLVIGVDDLNMPAKEDSGAQPPLELLRQLLDLGGWYDRKTLGMRKILGLQLVGTMGLPGGGRSPTSARLLGKVNFLLFN
jgi:dynein heavy chain